MFSPELFNKSDDFNSFQSNRATITSEQEEIIKNTAKTIITDTDFFKNRSRENSPQVGIDSLLKNNLGYCLDSLVSDTFESKLPLTVMTSQNDQIVNKQVLNTNQKNQTINEHTSCNPTSNKQPPCNKTSNKQPPCNQTSNKQTSCMQPPCIQSSNKQTSCMQPPCNQTSNKQTSCMQPLSVQNLGKEPGTRRSPILSKLQSRLIDYTDLSSSANSFESQNSLNTFLLPENYYQVNQMSASFLNALQNECIVQLKLNLKLPNLPFTTSKADTSSMNIKEKFKKKIFYDGKSSNDRVFGMPLNEVVERFGTPLPPAIMNIIILLKIRGPSFRQVFRRNAKRSIITNLKDCIQANPFMNDFSQFSIYEIADTFKLYLRSLSSTIFDRMHSIISKLNNSHNPRERLLLIQSCMICLPDENRIAIHYILDMLHQIAINSHMSEMSAESLAICISPSMFHSTADNHLNCIKNGQSYKPTNSYTSMLNSISGNPSTRPAYKSNNTYTAILNNTTNNHSTRLPHKSNNPYTAIFNNTTGHDVSAMLNSTANNPADKTTRIYNETNYRNINTIEETNRKNMNKFEENCQSNLYTTIPPPEGSTPDIGHKINTKINSNINANTNNKIGEFVNFSNCFGGNAPSKNGTTKKFRECKSIVLDNFQASNSPIVNPDETHFTSFQSLADSQISNRIMTCHNILEFMIENVNLLFMVPECFLKKILFIENGPPLLSDHIPNPNSLSKSPHHSQISFQNSDLVALYQDGINNFKYWKYSTVVNGIPIYQKKIEDKIPLPAFKGSIEFSNVPPPVIFHYLMNTSHFWNQEQKNYRVLRTLSPLSDIVFFEVGSGILKRSVTALREWRIFPDTDDALLSIKHVRLTDMDINNDRIMRELFPQKLQSVMEDQSLHIPKTKNSETLNIPNDENDDGAKQFSKSQFARNNNGNDNIDNCNVDVIENSCNANINNICNAEGTGNNDENSSTSTLCNNLIEENFNNLSIKTKKTSEDHSNIPEWTKNTANSRSGQKPLRTAGWLCESKTNGKENIPFSTKQSFEAKQNNSKLTIETKQNSQSFVESKPQPLDIYTSSGNNFVHMYNYQVHILKLKNGGCRLNLILRFDLKGNKPNFYHKIIPNLLSKELLCMKKIFSNYGR